ncbi:MAG: hypothetical protein K0Q51_195 [Rickettsiaceae bacterium]|jgi:hypothetical protein|nr:hypothetical protein [Rickettsiaceae bacterium]
MTSLYHIIDKIPLYEPYGIEEEYEQLAIQLVNSGLVRIDTDDKRNFVRFSYPQKNLNKAFSYKELHNESLKDKTINYFSSLYGSSLSNDSFNKKITIEIDKLKKEFSKLQPVSEELELKLTRLFVQSAHPIVIRWLLLERVEVFIAYSNMIGDVMDVKTWQIAGQNSGMQSTDGISAAIFVACGGNPFGETSKEHPIYGDGWPAIARLQIIAAQELGHYADMIRGPNLRHVDRHSADIMGMRAKPKALQARQNDIKSSKNFMLVLEPYGISNLIKHEEAIKFFRKNKVVSLRYLYHRILSYNYRIKIIKAASKVGFLFIRKFSTDQYLGLMLKALTEDMLFNLAPQADVYRRDDKDEEEAVACIEALARVPQQVIKWGHLPTQYFMGELYKIYFGEVIPDLIKTYEQVTGATYQRNYKRIPHSIKIKFKKFFNFLNPFKIQESLPSREV